MSEQIHEGRAYRDRDWPGGRRAADSSVTAPPYFFEDWIACDCPLDLVRYVERGRRVEVTLSQRDLSDLRSRAVHYQDHPDYELGMRSSARATVKAIDRQARA